MTAPAAQLALLSTAAPVAPAMPKPTDTEKRAQRAAQAGKCARCGGGTHTARGDIALDVVRSPAGVLIAFCRSDRLRYDGPERARKGAQKRTRRPHPPRGRTSGQSALKGIP